MKMDDDELFAKLNKVFDDLYGSDELDSDNDPDYHFKTYREDDGIFDSSSSDRISYDQFDDDSDELDELDNRIVLTGENGDVEFEFLDLIEYNGEEYVVLLPCDETEDAGEVVILKLEDADEDEESYVSVDNEDDLNAVFAIFKEKYKDEYNFMDED